MWGCEAVAVRHDGRANPQSADADAARRSRLDRCRLRDALVAAHRERFGASADADLLVGLAAHALGPLRAPRRLRSSGAADGQRASRFSIVAFRSGVRLLEDDDLEQLVADFVRAAKLAHEAGFAFVDIKHCHGYLGHELLGLRGRVPDASAARSRTARASCARSSRASARKCRA